LTAASCSRIGFYTQRHTPTSPRTWNRLLYLAKALRKTEFSEFCTFAKFETHLSVFRILYFPSKLYEFKIRNKYRIFGISKKNLFLTPKPGIPNIRYIQNYRVIIELLFLQNNCSDSNYNQIFDYKFGMQGLIWFHCLCLITKTGILTIVIFTKKPS